MKIDIQKIKKQLGFPSDRPLTLQEKRRYMKFAVYPLFFLIFAGIVLLIYSPTEKEKAERILKLRVAEPALGSATFLNEAVNQLAVKYMEHAQKARDERLSQEDYNREL